MGGVLLVLLRSDSTHGFERVTQFVVVKRLAVPLMCSMFLLAGCGGDSPAVQFTPEPTAVVPDVTGLRRPAAREAVEGAGLVLDVQRGAATDEPGLVSLQSPEPGTRIPVGSTVTVYVAQKWPKPKAEASTPKPKPTKRPRVQIDAPSDATLKASMVALVKAYNATDYGAARQYISDKVGVRCGGLSAWVEAFEQNHDTERINYTIHRVTVADVNSNGTVDADVAITERDRTDPDQVFLENSEIGLTFVEERRRWVLTENFPLGVDAFC